MKEAEKQMAKFAKQLDGEMGNMERRTNKAAKNMESSLSKGFSKMQGIVSEFGKGLFAGIAAGGVAGIAASVAKVTQAFADLGREAKTAGLNVEDFQRWRYVADQNRIGIDAMIDAFKELNIRGDEYAKTGKGGGADAFAQIGMSPAEVKERLKDPSALLLEIIDRTKRLQNTAAGVRIFDELLGGQGGEQFVRLIDQGRQGITATLKEADKMGAVMDENFIKRAEEVDKKFNQIANTIGSTLKAAIVDAVSALGAFISSWNELNEKSLSGIRDELDLLQKQKDRWESQPAGDWQDSVAGVFGKDRQSQLAAITARQKELNDELERRKNLTTPVVKDAPPVTPYIPPKTQTGKSDADKARDKAAKAAERERKAVTDLIKDLQFEASLVGKTALEKEKLTALRHAGAAATAAEKAQIEQLVEANYKATEAFDKQRAAIEEINDAGREFAGTLVDGLLSGAKATDVLSDALKGLASRFLNSGLDALFNGLTGGGQTSFLSGLIPGFASGGYTGGGGKNVPAGVVHKGEYVFDQDAVRKAGGPAALEAIRRGLKGYSGGGAVGVPSISAPRIPSLASMSQTNNNTQNNTPTINVNVSGANGNAEIAAMVQQGISKGLAEWQKQPTTTQWVGRQASIARTQYRVWR
ncbi:Phage tail length tape-measure protein 1 [Ochrobactrum soli]|uniref:Phage tail length tape-measure protein 1 n=1 Tax=Ochrobactrum soli TaxID=2448455 RepID=A0A2P9HH57_9HYPH|nr:Phage tail length tape-measure protein 1 [[Ochrobactrum] soli]